MTRHVIPQQQGDLKILNCVISYPHLFIPRAVGRPGQQTGDPKFSANFILPADLDNDDNAALQAAYQEAIAKQWPKGKPTGAFREPWKNGSEAGQDFTGRLMFSASSKADQPPAVYSQHGRLPPDQQAQIFAGCVVNVHVRMFGYSNISSGVAFALNGVQLVDNVNVKRIDGRLSSAAVFGVPDDQSPAAMFSTPETPQTDGPPAPAPLVPQTAQPGPAVPQQQQVQPGVPPAPQGAPLPGVPNITPGEPW